MSSDSEGHGNFLLPPRIAARFSRSTTSAARRKSSAASSRRNSISSHPSNRSALSAHGGPQSTHVAQHLRRASLLESRKARLAEKAAHAEKVRLRAAVAKAAPRVNANSEERALAAKQAREKYLAQVAANCHEEVKRAKRIAEDAREKKAAEHLRMKGEMEDRLAEAEKRRLLYQQNLRRSKNTTLAPVDERRAVVSAWIPRSTLEAAQFLQRVWRNRYRRKLASQLAQLGLTMGATKAASFDDVGALLNQESVLACTTNILRLYGIQEGDASSSTEKAAVRTFMSAFLALGHPQQVFSKEGFQEQDLIGKARVMLETFESLLATPLSHPGFLPLSPQLATFQEVYALFQSAFCAWKGHDSSFLVDTMLAQFVELDAIWQSVKNDTAGGVADDYKAGIQENQTLILVRLKKLLGSEEAMSLVRNAVKEARRTIARSKRVKSTKASRPRVNSGADITPDIAAHRSDPSENLQSHQWSHQAAALNEALTFLPDNRTIVHELAINREYRIDIKPKTDAKERIIRASSSYMRGGLESGLSDIFTVAMAQTVREKLLNLVPSGKSLHSLIKETLDLSGIAQQVKMGAFSYQQFFTFVNSMLPQLCAPVRDPEVKALLDDQTQDPIERLAKTNYVIDLLSLDHANFSLQMNAPMLLAEAPGYEKRRFLEVHGDRSLPRTEAWWRSAEAKCRADSRRRAGETTTGSPRMTAPDHIYMQGLVDLTVSVHLLRDTEIPETLELDRERIIRMRSDILRMISIAAILLTAKQLLKRDVRSQWKTEAQRMWQLPYEDAQAFLSAIPHTLPPQTKTMLIGTAERVLEDARSCQATHPVTKILLQKMQSHLLNRLTATSADERIQATTTASEALASCGLSEFISQIGALCDELKRVADVDRAAHGERYDLINASIHAPQVRQT